MTASTPTPLKQKNNQYDSNAMIVGAGKQTAKKSPKKFWVGKLVPFVFWQIIAILFVEFVLYTAGLGEEEIFKLDSDLGTRHLTNKRITWRSEGFAQSFFNEDGMREPNLTLSKPPGVYRIALLGDSLVEGLQVPLEKTFGQILEKRLTAQTKHKIQVLNFGTSGYSTAQEYLQLKKQVFKYNPDMVVLVYNNRDIFENWAPTDEVLTNIRPVALHLPMSKLVVHSYYVQRWMRSPRARFLNTIEWIRQNSRLWGLWAALDLDLTVHNPAYRSLVTTMNKPKQVIRDFIASTTTTYNNIFNPKANIPPPPPGKVIESKEEYFALVKRTMSSLLSDMNNQCLQHHSKFMVAIGPVRAALCPAPGMETSFYGVDYKYEIQMIADICRDNKIPMHNCEADAEKLSQDAKTGLFYFVHLKPNGHSFFANSLDGFLARQINQ